MRFVRSVFMHFTTRFFFHLLTIGALLLSSRDGVGQSAASALSRMEKGNWLKAEQQLRKALKKDTINPEARYVSSLLFFNSNYPNYQIDSAYHYALDAMSDFQKSAPRQKEKLKRFPLDSLILLNLRKKIDSAAFERAKNANTVESYQFFINQFTSAQQHDAAVELRDEVAFLGALKINSYKAFKDYLEKYPLSHRVGEAHKRYEKLLFEDKTRDGKLKSYEKFLTDYPSTPYRREVEKNIFEISTANGGPDAFLKFNELYPNSFFTAKSTDILYHLRQSDEPQFKQLTLSDSLRKVNELEKGYWVAIYKNEKFGFMDQDGKEMMTLSFDLVFEEYKCGEIRTDYVITSDGILSRSGETIYKGLTDEVTELGSGFLSVQDSLCRHVVHKSGYTLHSFCVENARLVANRFIAYQKDGKWGLTALNGRPLLAAEFEDIYSLRQIVVLVKSGKRSLKTPEQIGLLADKIVFTESLVFDEIKQLDADTYWVKNGVLEGTLNTKLEFVIPLDRQTLSKTPYGYVTMKDGKFGVMGMAKELAQEKFDEVRFYENWLALKSPRGLQLFNIPTNVTIASQLDSIWFSNHLAFARQVDTLQVFFGTGEKKVFSAESDFQFIKAPEGQLFFFTTEKNKKVVYDGSTGSKLFQTDFDDIEYFGDQIFMITRDGKKGLLSHEGKSVLPVEYNVIVVTQKDYASLFKDKKFGMFDLKKRKLIKPVYERNIKSFRENLFIASKDGFSGFINADAKPIGKFEFDEILPWNDSTALVKKNFQWLIYNWQSGKVSNEKIRDYRMVRDSEEEKIMIIHHENAYGVISSRNGTIIPTTFSDIVNIGSEEEPLYFTEKNVEEAGIYVVIYYNKDGKLLRRQVFEKDEYEEIYCEDR